MYHKKHAPDIYIAADIVTGICLCTAKALYYSFKSRLIVSVQNTMNNFEYYNLARKSIIRFSIWFSLKYADKIVCNSRGTKESLVSFIKLNTDSKLCSRIVVIGNPVIPGNAKSLLNSDLEINSIELNHKKIIINIARFHKQKNHHDLICIFKELLNHRNDIVLVLIGEGDELNPMIKLINDFGISESVFHFRYLDNPYPFLRMAHLFFLTSIWEGFGNVIVESLYCGTPVISYNCPGGPVEIIDDKNCGDLVPVGNKEKFISCALKRLACKKPTLKLVQKRALDYSVPKITEQYLE